MPNLAFYGAALVSYLFLAGPLLYLFLKARRPTARRTASTGRPRP